jgi:hypothetical protein
MCQLLRVVIACVSLLVSHAVSAQQRAFSADMRKIFRSSLFFKGAVLAAAFTLSACSPKFDWREVHGVEAPFAVLMPAKPATFSRAINLDGMQVKMTMTAAEVDDVTFAVGSAELPDAGKSGAALLAMKTALVHNIGGTIRSEKSSAHTQTGKPAASQIDIEAIGTPGANTAGQPRLLVARFIAQDKRIYQAIVLGREKALTREALDTFFTSFKLN